MFGARCSTELTNEITHVVAEKVRLSLFIFTFGHLMRDIQRGTVKVDAARRRGGILIVRLAWLMDSISLWRRQDETPYLLDDPRPGTIAEPSPSNVSVDPEPEEWQITSGATEAGPSSFKLDEVDWNEINDEVDAAMNESDDEDDDARSARSGNLSEDDWTDESNSIIRSV
jgi:RNA polymerase II subunit A-like phosphatase